MRLFTCKKYDFLIEKNLPSLSASRLNDLLPMGRVEETQAQRFLWVALWVGYVREQHFSF